MQSLHQESPVYKETCNLGIQKRWKGGEILSADKQKRSCKRDSCRLYLKMVHRKFLQGCKTVPWLGEDSGQE